MVQLILWNGGRNSAEDGYRNGDIVDMLEDGVHAGGALVAGKRWDGPVSAPFMVLDLPGTVIQANRRLTRSMTAASHVPSLSRTFRFMPARLSKATARGLQDRSQHRASPAWSEVQAVVEWKEGMSEARLRKRITANGRHPASWVPKKR